MENKPQNMFDKLDKQGEQVEDISKKLEGVSVNDLYTLAKRTWDYEDYQTAQKYYNHISLLQPLDWEAPLYASLCNFKGYHTTQFWVNATKQVEKIYISSIKYIYSLDLEQERKDVEMSKCLEIIKDDVIVFKDTYLNHNDILDEEDHNYYTYLLENTIFNTYVTIKDIKLSITSKFLIDFSNELLDLIDRTKKISSIITKENFDELLSKSDKKFEIDYDSIYEKRKVELNNSTDKLSYEEIKEIKLKGTMYFEYNDTVISKRKFIKNLVLGTMLIVLSIIGIVCSFLNELLYVLLFIFPILYGLVLIFSAFLFKNKMKCSSFLCFNRRKNRLSSDGNIITENRINPLKIFLSVDVIFQLYSCIYLVFQLVLSDVDITMEIIIMYCAIISTTILYSISIYSALIVRMDKFCGKFSYNYKGKNYIL